MFRKTLFSSLLLGSSFLLQADLLDDKIANIINQENYTLHQNLIDDVISNKDFYYQNNTINYEKLIKNLKINSLLEFSVPEQSEIKVLFHIQNGDKKSFKIIKNVLSNIGYSYYFTDYIKNDKDEILWQIRFVSDYTFDIYNFSEELSKFQSEITDVSKVSLTNWECGISTKNGILANLKVIDLDERISLQMPLEPYFLMVPKSKELLIASSQGNSWIPKISFFDSNLNSLGTIEMNTVYEGLKVLIPQNTKYIKISDRYSLLNIKRGLSVLVSNSL